LKTLALATIEAIEHPPQDPNKQRLLRSSYALDATIAYLRFHSEDEASRKRLIDVAIQTAKLLQSVQLWRSPGEHAAEKLHAGQQPRIPVTIAWSALLELEVLHPGMTTEAAIEILGPPSLRN